MDILKLATIFESKAQLPLGTSEPRPDKNKLMSFKDTIMQTKVEPKPGWSAPGQTAMKVIDKILNDSFISDEDKQWALLDVRANLKSIDETEFAAALGLY